MTEPDRHALPPALLHDLRTPLGQIIGYAELLAERAEEAGDERFGPDLQKISAAGYRMLALLEGAFTATRADAPGALTWDDVDTLRALGGRTLSPEDAERLAAGLAALLPPRV
ncbi:MAG TPA: histidine kinase dimerization/phospho-acceptor domain-containing protein [Longimicrobium sp.]|jgi:signal transduction histidine kinase